MSILNGRCDICGQKLLEVNDIHGEYKLRDCYSYYKLGYQNIFGPIKYTIFTKEICDSCFVKIMDYIETLKPPKKTDEWEDAFEKEGEAE